MEAVLHHYLADFATIILAAIIVAGLYFLSKGADILVDEAVSLSLSWGIPPVIIGATIISLGTTLPEASVSVLAAWQGNPDLALGNAVGSIIADTGLIIGLAALVGRLPVNPQLIKRQGTIQLGAGLLLVLVSLPFLSSRAGGHISQAVGIIFLILLILYIILSILWSLHHSGGKIRPTLTVPTDKNNSGLTTFLKLLFGIALVIGSSQILIPAVEITAVRMGIPQSIIAATLVALGTSLPELVMALNSVRKGHGELAVGNIIGADILNVLFVTGAAAAVTKEGLAVPPNYYSLQFPAMLIILLLFRLFTRGRNDEITKGEGLILLSIYVLYIGLNYLWLP